MTRGWRPLDVRLGTNPRVPRPMLMSGSGHQRLRCPQLAQVRGAETHRGAAPGSHPPDHRAHVGPRPLHSTQPHNLRGERDRDRDPVTGASDELRPLPQPWPLPPQLSHLSDNTQVVPAPVIEGETGSVTAERGRRGHQHTRDHQPVARGDQGGGQAGLGEQSDAGQDHSSLFQSAADFLTNVSIKFC